LKKINFIYDKYNYTKVLDTILNPILPYINTYKVSNSFDINCLNVEFFVEHSIRDCVFISHGIADKNWRNGNKTKDYKYIFVSGVAWKNKLISQGVNPDKIFINGYTKLDPIFQGKYKKNNYDKTTILFAPTHATIPNVSLYNRFDNILEKIPDDFILLKSEHPVQTKSDPTLQLLLDADIVIADSGSILYEAWSLGKQVIFADWLIKDGVNVNFHNSFEDYIYKQKIGLHAQDKNHFIKLLYKAKKEKISNQVNVFMKSIFPEELRGNSGKVTAKTLVTLAYK
jgi:CDP-glycerol glycerophosphotransferase (TagB/SpsB family)